MPSQQSRIDDHAILTSGYHHLLDLDRAGWAWEWLRRNPEFAAAHLAIEQPSKLGASIVVHSHLAPETSLLRWGLLYG